MTGMKKRSHTQTLLIVMVIISIAAGLAAFIFLDVGTAKKDVAENDTYKIRHTYTDSYKMTDIVEEYNTEKEGQRYSYLKYQLDHIIKEAILLKVEVPSPAQTVTLPAKLGNYPVIQIGMEEIEQPDHNERIAVKDKQEIDTIVIPEGVKRIGSDTFYKGNIREVFLPQSVRSIGSRTFAYSTVQIVHVKNKRTDFSTKCFADSSLEKIELPDGYRVTFGRGCFDRTLIREILWPVEEWEGDSLPYCMFRDCKELTTVKFPNGQDCISIPEDCFYGCEKLTKLVFPADTKKIKAGFSWYAENNRKAAPGTLVITGKDTVIESTCKKNGKNIFGAEVICAPEDSKAYEIAGESLRIRKLSKNLIQWADNQIFENKERPEKKHVKYVSMKRKKLR